MIEKTKILNLIKLQEIEEMQNELRKKMDKVDESSKIAITKQIKELSLLYIKLSANSDK